MPSRVEALRAFLRQRPEDPFTNYALAMELRSTGALEEARGLLAGLLAQHPDYVAAYVPAGDVLAALGLVDEARGVYRKGIDVCLHKGQRHAADQLQTALAALG